MQDMLSRAWTILTSTIVIRKEVFELFGGFPTAMPACGFEDPYILLRAREYGSFEYVPEPLVFYRLASFAVRTRKYEKGREYFWSWCAPDMAERRPACLWRLNVQLPLG